MKTQTEQTLEIARELAWLSFLKRRRGKISLYTAVCHLGIRLARKSTMSGYVLRGIARCLRDRRLLRGQTEDLGGCFGQVEVCPPELANSGIAALRRAYDQAGGFKVREASIKRSGRLERTSGQQLAPGEDCGKWLVGVYGSGEGSKHRTSACGQLGNLIRAMHGAEDFPRQVSFVAAELMEGVRVTGLKVSDILASNGMLRDRHSSRPFL
ncbi:hypothetical protein DF134_19245 [Burkholderia stagnalis]|uniref:hypothetical protein n=1 Tax=Burkholderia stagnalis TaxID=1503054 RepID=UPI000F5A6DEC|nr:hypothetical protein [Burkholderia stagnalis]RQQ88714.1 hypothetical protein DF134_19245 [Burkholderia stagnalis]